HRRRRPPPCPSPTRSIASSGSSCRSCSAEVGVCRGSPWARARWAASRAASRTSRRRSGAGEGKDSPCVWSWTTRRRPRAAAASSRSTIWSRGPTPPSGAPRASVSSRAIARRASSCPPSGLSCSPRRTSSARAVAERRIFSGDTPWQREFEAAFRFEETRDQLRAIEDTKRDMEGPRPMDRLVAGDVGYGKTEVALRAAFKAVADGRQVAVLVPTTVLAQQHFHTFSDRFLPFPTRVELLSRFRSPREQKAVVEGLKTGAVDVVIGTHRLLSKDVAFRDLGLLVVDEEHRFGVTHKERIKQLRTSVDVLTLTATPIPRTLYM